MSGREALGAAAPSVVAVFDRVASIPAPDLSAPAVAEFAEQFALDVSSIDAEQRSAFFTATGDQAFAVVQRIYAADFVPRVRSVLDAIFGASDWAAPGTEPTDVDPVETPDSWTTLQEFMVSVARLRALDAPLTELVRLRGARLHDCAVCKSRRSQDAIAAGATDQAFAAVDDHRSSGLPDETKAALVLTDALIWTPTAIPPADLVAIKASLSDVQVVEVVLDVMRNAANKIAVALGADAATVTDGVELFTTDADGNLSVLSA